MLVYISAKRKGEMSIVKSYHVSRRDNDSLGKRGKKAFNQF